MIRPSPPSTRIALPDAILFGATPRAVKSVVVAGRQIIAEGRHAQYDETLELYRKSLRKLELI